MSETRRPPTPITEALPELSLMTTLLHDVQVNSLESNRSEPAQALVELAGAAQLFVYQAAVVPLSIWAAIKRRPRS